MVIAKEPCRCKIVINEKIIEKITEFNYLGTIMSAYGDLKNVVNDEINKSVVFDRRFGFGFGPKHEFRLSFGYGHKMNLRLSPKLHSSPSSVMF